MAHLQGTSSWLPRLNRSELTNAGPVKRIGTGPRKKTRGAVLEQKTRNYCLAKSLYGRGTFVTELKFHYWAMLEVKTEPLDWWRMMTIHESFSYKYLDSSREMMGGGILCALFWQVAYWLALDTQSKSQLAWSLFSSHLGGFLLGTPVSSQTPKTCCKVNWLQHWSYNAPVWILVSPKCSNTYPRYQKFQSEGGSPTREYGATFLANQH